MVTLRLERAALPASAVEQDTQVPIDLWHSLLVLVPIAVLLVLYLWRRWTGPEAAPIGLLLVAVLALLAFRMPLEDLAVAAAKGMWDALPIVLIIAAALVLYRVGSAAGAFFALRRGVERVTKDRVFLVMSFGWIFASFTQGVVGFGVPLVIVAPILLALGVKPVYAVIIPLIGHAWANFFGTLGVGWTATTQVVQLEDETRTAALAAMLFIPSILLIGVGIAWLIGKGRAVRHAMPFILIQTVVLGGVQLVVVLFSPELSTFIAGIVALGVVLLLTRWRRYREPFELEESPALEEQDDDEDEREPVMSLWMALLPYGFLAVVSIVVLAIPPVTDVLGQWQIGLPFPATETGYGVIDEATDGYEPFAPLADSSFLVIVTAIVTWLVYRWRGHYRAWRRQEDPAPIFRSVLEDGAPAISVIVIFLMFASIYTASGQLDVLAFGIGAVAPPWLYAFLAPIIGVIGALITSSSTSSNVLFAPLQDAVASSQGLDQAPIIAAQSVGGSLGNVIAPVNLTVGASAVGMSGQIGTLMRISATWLLPVIVLIGLITIPLTLFLGQ